MKDGNKLAAEKAANKEFCTRLSIMAGNLIRASSQNIDDEDIRILMTVNNYIDIN